MVRLREPIDNNKMDEYNARSKLQIFYVIFVGNKKRQMQLPPVVS